MGHPPPTECITEHQEGRTTKGGHREEDPSGGTDSQANQVWNDEAHKGDGSAPGHTRPHTHSTHRQAQGPSPPDVDPLSVGTLLTAEHRLVADLQRLIRAASPARHAEIERREAPEREGPRWIR